MAVYKVTLGHAVSDENGHSHGGKPGDQKQNADNTKGECLFSGDMRRWRIYEV